MLLASLPWNVNVAEETPTVPLGPLSMKVFGVGERPWPVPVLVVTVVVETTEEVEVDVVSVVTTFSSAATLTVPAAWQLFFLLSSRTWARTWRRRSPHRCLRRFWGRRGGS